MEVSVICIGNGIGMLLVYRLEILVILADWQANSNDNRVRGSVCLKHMSFYFLIKLIILIFFGYLYCNVQADNSVFSKDTLIAI